MDTGRYAKVYTEGQSERLLYVLEALPEAAQVGSPRIYSRQPSSS
jgi:hypothetical protein